MYVDAQIVLDLAAQDPVQLAFMSFGMSPLFFEYLFVFWYSKIF